MLASPYALSLSVHWRPNFSTREKLQHFFSGFATHGIARRDEGDAGAVF